MGDFKNMWLQGNYIIWKGQRMRRGKIAAAQGEILGPFPAFGKSSSWEKQPVCYVCRRLRQAVLLPPQNGAIHAECNDERRPFSRSCHASSSCRKKVTGAWRPGGAKVHISSGHTIKASSKKC